MPRGQDAPIRRGGQVDPYVASSVQRGREQADNRLVAAMQESGATQRTAMQEQGASGRAAASIAGQRAMQAASIEAQDRRAAEAERGQREDREYQKMLIDTQQKFQAEQSRLQQEYETSVREKQWDRADGIYEQMKAADKAEAIFSTIDSANNMKAIMAVVAESGKSEQKKEEAITRLTVGKEEADDADKMANGIRDATISGFRTDKRMDFPVIADLEKERKIMREEVARPGIHTLFPAAVGLRAVRGIKEERRIGKEIEKGGPQPLAVLQDQIGFHVKAGVPISIEQLHPSRIHEIEKAIADNEIHPADIKNLLSIIDGGMESMHEKVKDAESDDAKAYFKEPYHTTVGMKATLRNLMYSDTKVEGGKYDTVGKVMKHAMGMGRVASATEMVRGIAGTGDISSTLDAIRNIWVDPRSQISADDMKGYSPATLKLVDERIALQQKIFRKTFGEPNELTELGE